MNNNDYSFLNLLKGAAVLVAISAVIGAVLGLITLVCT